MDLVCFDDLDQFAAEITDPLDSLEQDLYHRLIEPLGSNLDDPNRGIGIESVLSGQVPTELKSRIEREFEKDDRVKTATATITQNDPGTNAGASFRIEIEVITNDDVLAMDLTLTANGLAETPL